MSEIANKVASALTGLPPDPDGMNDKRAEMAQDAIKTFVKKARLKAEYEGSDRGIVVSDLLADIMHWCDRNGIDFDDRLYIAREHYSEETRG